MENIEYDFIPFLELFGEIDSKLSSGKIIVAIEGGSASGKTTLGKLLEEIYGCTVFHMDDYFLQPHQRTPDRFMEIGGNIDWERFLLEVLQPLKNGEIIRMRKFDCSSMTLKEVEEIIPTNLVIVEGAYSMHPNLANYYDLTVFLDIPKHLQEERIKKRNSPQMFTRFVNEWIPLEEMYFEKTDIKNRCNMIISIFK